MSAFTDLAEAFDEMADEFGATITFQNISKACISSAMRDAKDLMLNGYKVEGGASVTMKKSDYDALQCDVRDELRLDGKLLMLVLTDNNPSSPLIKLTLATTE